MTKYSGLIKRVDTSTKVNLRRILTMTNLIVPIQTATQL